MEFKALEFIVAKMDEIMRDEEAEYKDIGYKKKEEVEMLRNIETVPEILMRQNWYTARYNCLKFYATIGM